MSAKRTSVHTRLQRVLYRVIHYLDRLVRAGLGNRRRYWIVERALRYVPIAQEIEAKGAAGLKILDVGSGTSGMRPYLQAEPRLLVGADVDFPEELVVIPSRVRSSCFNLPFRSQAFDVVICMDVLEHIAPGARGDAIKEIVRVARRSVYIGFPAGVGAHEQDARLDRAWLEAWGERFPFLVEHLENPLPSEDDVRTALEQLQLCNVRITRHRNANLQMREWLMLWGFISRSPVKNFLAGRLPLVVLPCLLRMNWGPCYRQTFRIDLQAGQTD